MAGATHAFRARAAQDAGAVVFLGDSITQGWSSLDKDFATLKVANRGIGGDTTRGVRYRLNEDVISLHPKAVVLLIGTNDIGLGADPQDVAENIRQILLALRSANAEMPIIVCKVMPRSDGNLHVAGKIQDLNARVDKMVAADSHSYRCDTWSIYADANGNCPQAEFPDRLHPNALGYAKWKAALQPILAGLRLGN